MDSYEVLRSSKYAYLRGEALLQSTYLPNNPGSIPEKITSKTYIIIAKVFWIFTMPPVHYYQLFRYLLRIGISCWIVGLMSCSTPGAPNQDSQSRGLALSGSTIDSRHEGNILVLQEGSPLKDSIIIHKKAKV